MLIASGLLMQILPKRRGTICLLFMLHDILVRGGRLVRYNGCECGMENPAIPKFSLLDFRSRRIVGGNLVRKNQYPWMAGLFTRRFSRHPFCGASLISSTHLVTAAHCLEGVVARYASLGDHDTTTLRETRSFFRRLRPYRQSQVVHENYTNGGGKEFPLNDIAVLELAFPIRFSYSKYRNVRPLCLPDPTNDLEDEWVTAIGWGVKEYSGEGKTWHENHEQSAILREVDLKTFRQHECDLVYGGNGDVKSQHLCAYFEGRDACQGDSGGPLFAIRPISQTTDGISRYELVGITSFGRQCGVIGLPGLYTRAGNFLRWILAKLIRSPKDVTVVCRGTLGRWSRSGRRN